MKKLLSLVLCLMMLLPSLAMAEAEVVPALYTIDFGYFEMGLSESDYYQIAAERQDNTAYAIIYPNYDASDPSPNNINVVWGADNFSLQVKLFGASLYAQSMLQSTANLYQSMGYTMTNSQIHNAALEGDVFTTTFSYDLVAANGLSVTLYQLQNYYFRGDEGSYAFTITAHSMEELESLAFYLDHITFK